MKPFANYKTFDNMKLGGGALYLNNRHVGYLQGDVGVEVGLEAKVVESNTPQVQVGSIPTSAYFRLKPKMMQISPENYCEAIGVAQSNIKIWTGLNEYDAWWKTDLVDQQLLTATRRGGGDFVSLKLDHKNLVTAVDVPVFTKVASRTATTGTLLVSGTDYILDPKLGEILAIAGGALTENSLVRCKYKCIPDAGKEIALNPKGLLPGQNELLFEAVDAKSNKKVIIWIPKAESTAGNLTVNQDDIWILDATIEAVFDENPANADYPMGYAKFDIEKENL